jgi:glyoxylase-like metal-dependent hydrolase (beta-lactamase superfamily II)/rhodanese-related sulfurtransferase
MIFEQIRSGGCLSYLVACPETCAGVVVDPNLDQQNRYLALAAEKGVVLRYLIDTHTHADHFSAAREIGERLGIPVVMHRASAAPFAKLRVDDGDLIAVGTLRLHVLHTPGHTEDSMSIVLPDRVLTGDTLLIGGTGRSDLPTGDASALYDSLFEKILRLDDACGVYPGHDYKGRSSSTIGAERTDNARLQKKERGAFVEMMRNLNLTMPRHLTEALRTNRSGGRTVAELIAEASAQVPFMSMRELRTRIERGGGDLVVLDVREKDAFARGHLPGARHIPRGQLELRVDGELPDPTARIVTYCQMGKISTLAAATLRSIGFSRASALDGGYDAWSNAGYPIET